MEYYGFDMFRTIFFMVFFIIVGIFILNAVKGISQWSYNNNQPILDVDCRVVAKRINISRHAGHTDANGTHHSGSTSTM